MKEMKSSFAFMKMLPMFKEIPNYIIDLLNKQMEVRTLKPGDVLFKQGQPAKVFYIVKKGILHMNCLIDVEMYNKIPVDVDQWKLLKTVKTVQYRIRTLTTGDFIVSSDEI